MYKYLGVILNALLDFTETANVLSESNWFQLWTIVLLFGALNYTRNLIPYIM